MGLTEKAPRFCRKMWSNQETSVRKQVKNLYEIVEYAMHSSGKTSLAVGLSPYKIAKIDAFASNGVLPVNRTIKNNKFLYRQPIYGWRYF